MRYTGMLEKLLAADPGYRGPRVPYGQERIPVPSSHRSGVSFPENVVATD